MLNKKGVSVKELSEFFKNGKHVTWGTLLGENLNESVSLLILDEPEVQLSVSKFLEVDPSVLASANKKSIEDFLKAYER